VKDQNNCQWEKADCGCQSFFVGVVGRGSGESGVREVEECGKSRGKKEKWFS